MPPGRALRTLILRASIFFAGFAVRFSQKMRLKLKTQVINGFVVPTSARTKGFVVVDGGGGGAKLF